MLNLVITVIAIALFVIFATYGVGHINTDYFTQKKLESNIETAILIVNSATVRHMNLQGDPPSGINDLVPHQIKKLPEVNGRIGWDNSGEFKLNTSANDTFICLGSTELSELDSKAILSISNKYNSNTLVVKDCAGFEPLDDELYPKSVWLAIKVK